MSFRAAALGAVLASGCATMSAPLPNANVPKTPHVPVLLAHGIDDTARNLRPIARRLHKLGWAEAEVEICEFHPNDGTGGLLPLVEQLDRSARALAARTGAEKIDIVAFSMGALVARYWLMRVPGHVPVRRYVSISGPHHGTLIGYLRWNAGGEQMRPNSRLLLDLAKDEGQWGAVEVYSFWTPLDLVVVPAISSRLKGAVERTFPVVLHPLMMYDGRVISAVAEALGGPALR
jgi:triacylglycerol esterase/lipase EstA (alpha/beta hydrolase family)